LGQEFLRDRLAGKDIGIPFNYFPADDPARPAANVWQPFAHLLFGNWLGEIGRTTWTRDASHRVARRYVCHPLPGQGSPTAPR
jgi:homoserine trans-succinylase